MKLWGGRFTQSTEASVDEFNASIYFDKVLAEVDIIGSIAHVKMLAKCQVISDDEMQQIVTGLQTILKNIETGDIDFSVADEDIHMNIERLLHQEIGEVAGKLHTGRSRNDQVALDLHLYLREHVVLLVEKIVDLQIALVEQAKQHIDTILPGYTHLQRAQPVRLAHHLLTYFAMLQRDCKRLKESMSRINTMPLGAGALAGSGFSIDRNYVAELLNFEDLYENSMDAVSDRDFIVEFLSHASLIMMHLSRFSEELILWSSQEFSFIELSDAYCTGSSMMPQKKNPDVAELVRGKTGRVYGSLIGVLTMLKGLPLTYNKDMQEDKEALFDTLKTVHDALSLYAPMIKTMKVKAAHMKEAAQQGYSNATELADYLVNKGMPFRQAHEIVGKLVLKCIEENIFLTELPLQAYQDYSSLFDEDIYQHLHLENVVDARNVRGGTKKQAVLEQFIWVEEKLASSQAWLQQAKEAYCK